MEGNMKKIALLLCMFLLSGCGTPTVDNVTQPEENATEDKSQAVTAEETELEKKEKFLDEKLENMTLEEKIGQLFMLAYRKNEDGSNATELTQDIKSSLQERKPGGVILFGENIDTPEQVKQLIADMQESSYIPLFIGVDEEGGRVSRLQTSGKMNVVEIPPAEDIGKSGDITKAYDVGKVIGEELKELGFNVDFAPVADINTNPDNPVIGDRAFGSDPQLVSDMVAAFIDGLHQKNMSAAVKHFPGHGDTSTDTHLGETVMEHDRNRLDTVELVPFRRAIAADVDFIMAAHILTPNVTTDGLPASLSKQMLTGILREELGYDGLIITDAMDMGAIVKVYGSGEAAVLAIEAGADIVLMPANVEEAYEAIQEAVESGRISGEALAEKVKRILSFKYEKGYFAEDN